MIRIDEAVALKNARQRKLNLKRGRPENKGIIFISTISRIMFPHIKIHSDKMRYIRKDAKSIKPDWIPKICEITEVDPNFLFGFESKHDKDFNELIKNE